MKQHEIRIQTGCTEAGDIIATAQYLIEAGLKNNDQSSIEAGIAIWKEAWPSDVVDLAAHAIISDFLKDNP